jgi:hypothetical protein
MARFVTAILIGCSRREAKIEGKDQTIARTLASKPRASEEITLPGGRCRRGKVAPLSLFHGPTR